MAMTQRFTNRLHRRTNAFSANEFYHGAHLPARDQDRTQETINYVV